MTTTCARCSVRDAHFDGPEDEPLCIVCAERLYGREPSL